MNKKFFPIRACSAFLLDLALVMSSLAVQAVLSGQALVSFGSKAAGETGQARVTLRARAAVNTRHTCKHAFRWNIIYMPNIVFGACSYVIRDKKGKILVHWQTEQANKVLVA